MSGWPESNRLGLSPCLGEPRGAYQSANTLTVISSLAAAHVTVDSGGKEVPVGVGLRSVPSDR
jgi:hypothetical protein